MAHSRMKVSAICVHILGESALKNLRIYKKSMGRWQLIFFVESFWCQKLLNFSYSNFQRVLSFLSSHYLQSVFIYLSVVVFSLMQKGMLKRLNMLTKIPLLFNTTYCLFAYAKVCLRGLTC